MQVWRINSSSSSSSDISQADAGFAINREQVRLAAVALSSSSLGQVPPVCLWS